MCKLYFLFLFSFFCFGSEVEVCSDNTSVNSCEIILHNDRDDRGKSDRVYIKEKDGNLLSDSDSAYDVGFMLLKRGNVYLLQYTNSGNVKGYDYLFFKVENKNKKIKIISFLSFDEQIDYNQGGSYGSGINCVNNNNLYFDDLFKAGWNLCNSLSKQPRREKIKHAKYKNKFIVSVKEIGTNLSVHKFLFSYLDFSDVSDAKDLTKIIDGENNLSGSIDNKYHIDVDLMKSNNSLIGNYNYKGKDSIDITGHLNDEGLVIDEWVNCKKNAKFELEYHDGYYSGYWSDTNKKLPAILYKMVF